MHANEPSTDQLGEILIDIHRAGGSPAVLGRFAVAHTGSNHPSLTADAFGEVIRNLLVSTNQSGVIGRFVSMQMERPIRSEAPDLNAVHTEKTVEAGAVVSGVRPKTIPLKMKVNGRMTSVSVDRAAHDLYVSRYGVAGRSALLARVAKMRLSPGSTRSFLANREISRANESYGTVSPLRAV